MRAGRLSLLVVAALAAACSDVAPVSGPGTMTATVVGPNGAEGAALIELLGGEIGDITSVGDTEVFAQRGLASTRVVLINQNGGTLAFQVAVADTTEPPAWLVQQVAAPDDALRTDASTYGLDFGR
jgi:ABC-type hemin transport system ATPase subunit